MLFSVHIKMEEKIVHWPHFAYTCQLHGSLVQLYITKLLHLHKKVISQASFFPDPFTTRFVPTFLCCLDFVHALSLSCKNLFTWLIFKRERLFLLNTKRINCYRRSYLSRFSVIFWALTELNKFLSNCLVSNFCSTVALLKISYSCSICSLVFRRRMCCEAQLRLCVANCRGMRMKRYYLDNTYQNSENFMGKNRFFEEKWKKFDYKINFILNPE